MRGEGDRPTVLTVAGSDPSGGAGLQADLRTVEAMGCRGVSAVTAITAQTLEGVRRVFPVGSRALAAQLRSVLEGGRVAGAKTGMLWSAGNVRETARMLGRVGPRLLVVDPVLVSSNGVPLLRPEALPVLVEELFPLAAVITPNLAEAEVLSRRPRRPGEPRRAWIRAMARRLHELGPRAVVITGGHAAGAPVDLVFDGRRFHSLAGRRLPGSLHGSGCIFSAALLAGMVRGLDPVAAAARAKAEVERHFPRRA